MNNVIRDSLISLIRQLIAFGLGGVAGWASKHGLDFAPQLSVIMSIAPIFLVNVLWSVTSHLLKKWRINAALLLEPHATNAQLDAAVAATPVLQRLQEAMTTPEREQPGALLAQKP